MIKRLLKDDFLKNNVIFFIGSMAVAVLNYLYHPVLGRMLSVEDFGEVQSLISLFMQLAVFTGIFNMLVINVTTNYEDLTERDALISALRKVSFYIVGFLFVVILLSSTLLQSFFHFESFYPFIALAFLFLTGVNFTFRKAYLQGVSNFKAVSGASIVFAGGKLVFAALLVYLGWRTFGAISGLLLAQGLALIYVYLKTRKELHLTLRVKQKIGEVIKHEYRYALLIFLSTSAVAFLYTADVLMVKHWFSPEEAGLYSGIATIARIILFASGSVAGVLVSAVKVRNTASENRQILKKGLALTLLIAGGGFVVFSLFSDLVIKILIGSRYVAFAPLLSELSLLLALVAVINLLFFYFLALRNTIIIGAALAGPLTILILSIFRHSSPEEIVYNFIIGSVVVLLVLFKGVFRGVAKEVGPQVI